MKLFSGSSNKPLCQKIARELQIDLSPLEIHIFPDGEKRIRIEESVVDEHCIVVQSTNPPVDENYMELLFILDALKRNGAKSVTVVMPYIGYQRQDHVFREGESRSLEVVVRALEVTGANRFIAVDFHSIKIPEIFQIPVVHLSGLDIFAEKIKELFPDLQTVVLVTPDMGGIRRIKILSETLNNMPFVTIEKNRDLASGSITVGKIEGNILPNAVIIDDMISSGKTIVQAATLLKEKGAKHIVAFATHPVFSDNAPKILQDSPVENFFVTDTIDVPEEKHFSKLEVLSVSRLISESIS